MSREVWQYRFGGSFHPATRQCFLYTLARLYEEPAPGNSFHGNPELMDRLRSVVTFTLSLQNRDGSFSEWYRGQSSYCSTAYLSAYLSETILRLSGEMDAPVRESAVRSLSAAAKRLSRHAPGIPANQLSAGLLALRNCTTLLGGSWDRRALATRDRLLASAGTGGWFSEYGGPDLGYQTLTLDFLSRCVDRGLDGLEEAILRGISFLDRFVMPDGSAPAGLSWRETAFLMPYALERWTPFSAPAADLSRRLRGAVEEGRLPSPASVDDRYAAHLFLPSFVDAHFAAIAAAPTRDTGTISCREISGTDDGGLRVFPGDTFVCVMQARTGAVSVFSRELGKVVLEGPMYRLVAQGGTFVPAPSKDFRFPGESEYTLETSFRKTRGEGGAARMGAAILPLMASIGERIHPGIPEKLDTVVRQYVFGTGRKAPVRLRRSISVERDSIRIRDSIGIDAGASRGKLVCTFRAVPSIHPSSGFFTPSELDAPSAGREGLAEAFQAAWDASAPVDLEMEIARAASGVLLRCRLNGREIGREAPLAGLLC